MEHKKIKILYLITKGNFGGAQRYVFDLATNLGNLYEVTVAMGQGDILNKKLEEKGVRTITIKTLGRNFNIISDIATFWHIIRIIRQERPDIIHLNSSKAGALGALAVRTICTINRILKKKYCPRSIFTGHGWAFNEERTILAKGVIGLLHWATIMLSHKTIAVSDMVKSQISIFPFVEEKIIRIYNGIIPPPFLDKETARKELSKKTDILQWIGTISELHRNKGIDFIIRAFASISKDFPKSELFIIGEGEERHKLERMIRSFSLETRIHLLGFKQDASKYLKAFDIFTLTSRTEAFPYAPLEAGCASLPIIASRVGGIPEIISNKENGILVEKGNVFDIEYSLRELLQNQQKGILWGERLKETVINDFSLERMVSQTKSLYEVLVRV